MTDCHIVETKKNELWEDEKNIARAKISAEIEGILHFCCAMHPLLQFADAAEGL